MAHYVVHVRSPRSPAEVFGYMADLTNFAEWDPGVERSEQVEGDGPGADAAYDVAVKAVVRPLVLRYHITRYDPPEVFVAEAKSALFTSIDSVTVRADGTGSVVTYDAELTLNGPLGLADPLLGLAFERIGDRAAKGLIRALDGERTEAPVS